MTKVELLKDKLNQQLKMDGLELLKVIPDNIIKTVFFDPQYRGLLDKQKYGDEGISKTKRRCALDQMDEQTIINFIVDIDRVLVPSGHLFLWIDKFHLCEGVSKWFLNSNLQTVDLIVWEKPRIGLGYRSRNKCEFLLVLQKKPVRVKGCWKLHNIPNVWEEGVITNIHPHSKPINLQSRLIEATTEPGDYVLDPAMGSGSILKCCEVLNRNFIGGDIYGTFEKD